MHAPTTPTWLNWTPGAPADHTPAGEAGPVTHRIHNFTVKNEAEAARILHRILAGEDLIAAAFTNQPRPQPESPRPAQSFAPTQQPTPAPTIPQATQISDPEAFSELDEDGFVRPQPGTVPNPGAHLRPEPEPASPAEAPQPNPDPGVTHVPTPSPAPTPAELDADRVELILPEGLEAPQRGGPAVYWVENNGTQASLRIDELGQRYWRFVQTNGVIIDVTQGGGSDGGDRPWTHTTITEPGEATPREDTYDTTGVTVNVETTADTELRDLRFPGGDLGLEEHHGGSDGADRPWVLTTQFKPNVDPTALPSRVFTTSTNATRTGFDLSSEYSWTDAAGIEFNRHEDWTNDRRVDTITTIDPATGKPFTYVNIQRLSDRTPLLDKSTDVDGITRVIDHTAVDKWGNPATYHIRPDGTLWDSNGNQIGIADGKLVPFDADGNYRATGTDGVSVRDADADEPVRSNGYRFWAFWLTPDEREVIEPLTRIHAPNGGPAKAYFRTPNGDLIVQDDNGFHQVNNAPTFSQLALNIGLQLLVDGIASGGAGRLARLSSRSPFGRPQRPQLQQGSNTDNSVPRTGSNGGPRGSETEGRTTSPQNGQPGPADNPATGNRAVELESETRVEGGPSAREAQDAAQNARDEATARARLLANADSRLQRAGVNPDDIYGPLPTDHAGRDRVANVVVNNPFSKKSPGMDRRAYEFALNHGGRGNPWRFANAYEYYKTKFSEAIKSFNPSLHPNQSKYAVVAREFDDSAVAADLARDVETVLAAGRGPITIDQNLKGTALANAVQRSEKLGFGDAVAAAYHAPKHIDEVPTTEQAGKSVIRAYQESAARTVREGKLVSYEEKADGSSKLVFHREISEDGKSIVTETIVIVDSSGVARIATYGSPKAVSPQ
ncbi:MULTISPECIES: hypothetical protein [unclassified Nocardia]|uniref:hypothetical protein n=1 Tax=unclassified Nocardia TaxID=2637762 RepID=UPI0024A990FF|nr:MULTISPECIES: hypothetical protein [unclassified Nocardia]